MCPVGPIGLYTALQLTKIGFSVRIIGKFLLLGVW